MRQVMQTMEPSLAFFHADLNMLSFHCLVLCLGSLYTALSFTVGISCWPMSPASWRGGDASAVPELLAVAGGDATDPSSLLSSWGMWWRWTRLWVQTVSAPGSSSPVQTSCAGLCSTSQTTQSSTKDLWHCHRRPHQRRGTTEHTESSLRTL